MHSHFIPTQNTRTNMERNRPRLSPITIKLNKQFFAMVFFISTFLLASYYAPEHIPQQPPTQIKIKSEELHYIPRPRNNAGFLLLIYSTSHRMQQPPHTTATTRTGQCSKNFKNKFITPEPTDKSTN